MKNKIIIVLILVLVVASGIYIFLRQKRAAIYTPLEKLENTTYSVGGEVVKISEDKLTIRVSQVSPTTKRFEYVQKVVSITPQTQFFIFENNKLTVGSIMDVLQNSQISVECKDQNNIVADNIFINK